MFTGIVQAMGKVVSVAPQKLGVRLVIDRTAWDYTGPPIALGDSVCVSGVCLTVAAADAKTLGFDVIAETLRMTTLGGLLPGAGAAVNLEPSITGATPMGGHFVQGHVDAVGVVERVAKSDQEWRVAIRLPAEVVDFVIPKGSITVDGVSLTVAAAGRDGVFEVALIPTTLRLTTLGGYEAGTRVNIETDILSRTVVHYLRGMREKGAAVTMETLKRAGFAS